MNFFQKVIFKKILFIVVLSVMHTGYVVSHPDDGVPAMRYDAEAVAASNNGEQKPLIIDPAIMFGYQCAGKCLALFASNTALIYGPLNLQPSYLIDYVAHGAGLWHHKYSLRQIMPILLKNLLKNAALSHMHDELAHAYGYQPVWLENHAIISFMARTVASSLLASMISQGYSTVFENR